MRPAPHDGWDNWTFRLGDTMKVRLPSAASYVSQAEKEAKWLPRLGPHLPVSIPVPRAVGSPAEAYPFPWSIYDWLPGETAAREQIPDLSACAADVAAFLRALQAIDPAGGPPAGKDTFFRGGDLSVYDAETRACIAELGDRVDGSAALAVWEAALASRWEGSPVWVHGDVAVGNLLVADGRLAAVIDFGQLCVGDPACDLVLAWTFLDSPSRAAFRAALAADAGTWVRARGWALWKALLILARNLPVNPAETPPAAVVAAVLADA